MFEIMNEQSFKDLFPNNNCFEIEEMDKETRESYFLLTSAYRYFLTKYLEEKLELSKYDEEIEKSEYSFIPISKDEMDYYQEFNSDTYKYIFLRNNVYIGNLSDEERDKLLDLIKNNKLEYNVDVKDYIESTYKKVIHEKSKGNGVIKVNFGPLSESFFSPNNSLVLGIRYDEYNLNGKSDDEWDKNHELQMKKINEIRNRLISNVTQQLNISCSLILYDEFSIVKKNADEIKR